MTWSQWMCIRPIASRGVMELAQGFDRLLRNLTSMLNLLSPMKIDRFDVTSTVQRFEPAMTVFSPLFSHLSLTHVPHTLKQGAENGAVKAPTQVGSATGNSCRHSTLLQEHFWKICFLKFSSSTPRNDNCHRFCFSGPQM